MKRKLKYFAILFLLMSFFIFLTLSSYANTVSQDLSDNFFRLHIIANSNSEEDQELKLKIRDKIIEYMNTKITNTSNKSDVVTMVSSNLKTYEKIAKEVIEAEGYNYTVSAELGNFSFPTKVYGNISLPAGYYDALRIKIGAAQGENWWCSLFPPLCFVDISSGVIDESNKKNLKENLSAEEFAIITSSDEKIKFKFKILEIFAK